MVTFFVFFPKNHPESHERVPARSAGLRVFAGPPAALLLPSPPPMAGKFCDRGWGGGLKTKDGG